MLVAITGASGFVGRHLFQFHCSKGDEIRILSRKTSSGENNVQYFQANLTDPGVDLLPFVRGVDVLYHCAGELKDESIMRALHVDGTRALLEAAAGRVKRWVQLSSVGVYGRQREGVVDEFSVESPVGLYETTKAMSDKLVLDILGKTQTEYVILRPSNIFGIDMKNQSLFHLIDKMNKKFFFYIGKPGARANYIHVSSVVNALFLCATHEKAKNEVFILSDSISFEQMVQAISRGLEISQPVIKIPEKMVRSIAILFKKFNNFPLTESRIDSMTIRSTYRTKKIIDELGFKYASSLMDYFYEFAKQYKTKE